MRFSGTPKATQGPSQRQLRFGENVRHLLVEALQRADSGSQLLDNASITVSEVRVTPDLLTANAYVIPLGGIHADEIVKELNAYTKHFRAQIAKGLKSRGTPRIFFKVDHSFEDADRLEKLLRDPKVLRDLESGE
ncbi:30S ribosome-binding factor RbfA [Candidatus Bealeia paramacronuclearis]|uniref:Ribosome-binding factor A n=1 Tax=Candidatus Bealeia paramacronuclearis TaxID=1921001 RepID=A0ABZ2C2B6_9PROT|nr:30S ribosome-binding factor RbfA [Candidatus Bealeia paramacronuclearis]